MGKTSTKVKDRWNEAHYDRVALRVSKGEKEVYMRQAEEKGYKSLNSYIISLLEKDSEAPNEK